MKAATGEEVSAEELGGADVHTRIPASPTTSPTTTTTPWRSCADRRHADGPRTPSSEVPARSPPRTQPSSTASPPTCASRMT